MERYQAENIQVTAVNDASGASVARQLSQKLMGFGAAMGDIRANIVEKQNLQEGMLAGMNKELPKKNEFSLANEAFNKGLRASYLAEMQSDIRNNVSRISQENALDPVAFENAALAWEAETLNSIDDLELKVGIKQAIRDQSIRAYQSIADSARERAIGEMRITTNNEINALDSEAQAFGFSGDLDNSANAVLKAWDVIDQQVDANLIDAEEGQKKKVEIQKRAEVERVAGETWGKFQTLESFDEALMFLEQKGTPKNFTAEEWRTTKQRIETDLRQKLDRENLDEANNAKVSKELQDANFSDALSRMVLGELESSDVMNMVRTRQISGEQGVTLSERMGTRGRGVNNPATQNQIELAIFAGDYKKAHDMVISNMGIHLSDGTARDYLRRLQERGDASLPINTDEAKRYQQHLKTFIGYKDSMSGFIDPTMQQRWGAAILQYEDEVNAGGAPRDVMFKVVNQFTTPEQRFESMRNPITSDNKDDLNASLLKLQQLKDQGRISPKRYEEEASYILDQLIPAKEENLMWQQMQKEFKNMKAAAQ